MMSVGSGQKCGCLPLRSVGVPIHHRWHRLAGWAGSQGFGRTWVLPFLSGDAILLIHPNDSVFICSVLGGNQLSTSHGVAVVNIRIERHTTLLGYGCVCQVQRDAKNSRMQVQYDSTPTFRNQGNRRNRHSTPFSSTHSWRNPSKLTHAYWVLNDAKCCKRTCRYVDFFVASFCISPDFPTFPKILFY